MGISCVVAVYLFFSSVYVCANEREIIQRYLFRQRIVYGWGSVNSAETSCVKTGRFGATSLLRLKLYFKDKRGLFFWENDLNQMNLEEAAKLKVIIRLLNENKIPLQRGNIDKCKDDFLYYKLTGPSEAYDQPEIWETVKSIFVGSQTK